MVNEPDIIDDMLRYATKTVPGFQEHAETVEKYIRSTWSGDRIYIRGGNNIRNKAIVRDYRNGERVPLLERRYGLCKARIWQILKQNV